MRTCGGTTSSGLSEADSSSPNRTVEASGSQRDLSGYPSKPLCKDTNPRHVLKLLKNGSSKARECTGKH
jgi:hypothetical protein